MKSLRTSQLTSLLCLLTGLLAVIICPAHAADPFPVSIQVAASKPTGELKPI